MSKCHRETITCPNCNTIGEFMCWDSINVDLDPENREKVKNGELFQYICPKCKRSYTIEYETLYHDMNNRFMVQYLANPSKERIKKYFEDLNQIRGINNKYNLNFNEKLRITLERNDFIEKIYIFEAGLEDFYVEMTKIVVTEQFNRTHPNEIMPKIYFSGLDDENIHFSTDDGRGVDIDRNLLDNISNDYEIIAPENEFIQVDKTNVMKYVKEKSEKKIIDSKSGIVGLAIGDAMGVPLEFQIREKLQENPVKDMIGYKSHNMPKGTWSDDTSMTLALMDAITITNHIVPKHIADNFIKWAEEAEYTATGERFDIGRTCLQAIMNCEKGIYPTEAGLDGELNNGNGSLMRILPVAYYCYFRNLSEEDIYCAVKSVSSITHRHEISIMGCYIYVLYAIELLKGNSLENSYKNIKQKDYSMFSDKCKEEYKRILNKNISDYSIDDISSKGYVVYTLEATLWCLLTTENFDSAIIKAINLGNDTDTIGACTGGLAGIYYGLENINKTWKSELLKYNYIVDLCDKFNKTLNM